MRKLIKPSGYATGLFFLFLSCAQNPVEANKASNQNQPEVKVEPSLVHTNNVYSWLKTYDSHQALVNQIKPTSGYKRTKVELNSFADWLRFLPLNNSTTVKLYDGSPKGNQNAHHRILDIDVGNQNLQQCADAIMRLKSEYHYSVQDFSAIHFNFTSGDKVSFSDWSVGRKPKVKGNKVSFSEKSGEPNYSYSNFKSYLISIFNYAGTASMSNEMVKTPVKEMEIGDVFIQGGFPGHAIIIVDMIENDKGQKQFLIAQSYMPAQEIHILKNPNNKSISPWYDADFAGELISPEWTFNSTDLKRFKLRP